MTTAYIIEAVRTPSGRRNGLLRPMRPIELAAFILRALVERANIEPEQIDDAIMGCVTETGEQGGNIARLATLHAGFPVTVPAVTLNRMCGSGQQAIHFAAQAVLAGDMDLVIGGGVESMSRVPMGSDWNFTALPAGFPFDLVPQGISAEMMAEKWNLSREVLDDFAYESHLRAARATHEGRFDREIAPVEVPLDGGTRTVRVDEGIRFEPDREKMAALQPAFKPGGVITAANASQISDGAAALLVASERAVREYGLRPRARIVARAVVGTDPVLMLDGPIPSTSRVLERAGLTLDDIACFEVNEAFASVVLAWQRETGVDLERVNVNGGAIALGHPLGATGARLMTTLLHELERTGGRYGLQTMCIGWGMATATIIERIA
ncbi:MAG: thiolase family protein [Chloroflexi bacterium]|nr:thiolase family protein [Chloroflexota bacterium]